MTDKERIEKEADEFAFMVPYDGTENFYDKGKYEGYIAGATAEHELLTPQLEYANSTIKKFSEALVEREQELQAYRDMIRELLPLAEHEIKMSTCIGYSYDKWKSTISKARKLIDTVTPTYK